MEIFSNQSCADFSAALAARQPVPGGGGACALTGSLAAALAVMVGNYTVGKKKFKEKEPEILTLMAEAEDLRGRFLALIDADAAAFAPLSRAYAIPKDAPERAAVMAECLKNAAAVPMEAARLAARTLAIHAALADGRASAVIISDAATGAALARSALEGAVINVRVNTRAMEDRAFAEELNRECQALLDSALPLAEKTAASVGRRLM